MLQLKKMAVELLNTRFRRLGVEAAQRTQAVAALQADVIQECERQAVLGFHSVTFRDRNPGHAALVAEFLRGQELVVELRPTEFMVSWR